MKIKRFLAVLLTVMLMVGVIPFGAFTANADTSVYYTSGYYTYTVLNGETKITDCKTSISGDVTIPSILGGYPVTRIGNYVF